MNSITIYSDNTSLSTFITKDYTLEQLQDYYNTAGSFGNKSKVIQCVICAKMQSTLIAKYNGNTNSKDYKKEANTIIVATNMKKNNFNKYSQIGRYVLEQNDIGLYDKPLSDIQSKFLPSPSKPKSPPKVKPDYESILAQKDKYIQELKDQIESLNAKLNEANSIIVATNTDEIDSLKNTITKLESSVKHYKQDSKKYVAFMDYLTAASNGDTAEADRKAASIFKRFIKD